MIQTLERYFSQLNAAEKQKGYNLVLGNTLADLTSLKAQVTQVHEDIQVTEAARISSAGLLSPGEGIGNPLASVGDNLVNTTASLAPTITATVGTVGAAVVGTGLIDKK